MSSRLYGISRQGRAGDLSSRLDLVDDPIPAFDGLDGHGYAVREWFQIGSFVLDPLLVNPSAFFIPHERKGIAFVRLKGYTHLHSALSYSHCKERSDEAISSTE